MRRRLGLADVKEPHAAVFETRANSCWLRCDRYEIQGHEIIAAPDRVRGLERGLTEQDDEGWTVYNPINEVPDLFLRFARLYGEPDFDKVALGFANKYGLPSGNDERPAPFREPGFETEALAWSLSQFRHEARRAWVTLALYESVLNDEDQTVRQLLSKHGDFEPFETWLDYLKMDRDEDQNWALAVGFSCAVGATEEVVHKYCRQESVLSLYPDVRPSVSHEMDIAWTFDTLLGAMYLQMYWMMASSDSKSRCEHCGQIISLGRPYPDGRKRRRDKRFCDDACRQAHHRSKQVS
jgi:hypothetical protein